MIRRTCLLMAGLFVVVSVLTACSTGQPWFSQMSGEQLYSYNWDKPFAQQVSCKRLPTANSRIPRRTCLSNARWAHYYASGFARLEMMMPGGTRDPASRH